MLQKIIEIKNVGVFEDYSAKGNVALTDATLIYAGNGQGKTTVSAILRSLRDDESSLKGRERLGSSGSCSVRIRSQSGNHKYLPHSWDSPYDRIEVFDEEFVHSNVHSGYFVDREHKRSLYQVVIGEEGTRLAKDVEQLDEEITELNSKLREAKLDLEEKIKGSIKVDDFVGLPEEETLEDKLKSVEAEIDLAKRQSEIKQEEGLKEVTVPEIPNDLSSLLEQSLDHVSQHAMQRVREHIDDRLGPDSEPWVQKGLAYVEEDRCPFCNQGLEGVELVQAYRHYFSEEYRDLQKRVLKAKEAIESKLSDSNLQHLREELESCQERKEFWDDVADVELEIPEPNSVIPDLRRLKNRLIQRLDTKESAPLKPLEVGPRAEESLSDYHDIVKGLTALNSSVASANERIDEKKKELAAADVQELRTKEERLKNIEIRHSESGSELVDQYREKLASKKQLEERKDQTKEELDSHAKEVFPKFQKRINHHLRNFGAGFRICKVKPNYVGRKPNSEYALEINDEVVPLGSNETTDEPAFRNTLSAGDKSALALAFFLARLDLEQNLEDFVVVFDDPIASFDSVRQTYTRNEIARVFERSQQGIVLSHDPYFLLRLHRRLRRVREDGSDPIGTLEIGPGPKGSRLVEWDIEKDAKTSFAKNCHTMRACLEGTSEADEEKAIRAIRPALEHNLRSRFPGTFSPGENLSDYLAKVRAADSGSAIASLKDKYDEMDDLNEFTAPYHHAPTPDQAPLRINPAELRTNIEKTFRLMRG